MHVHKALSNETFSTSLN